MFDKIRKLKEQAILVEKETGKTPRELQQGRDEALAALERLVDDPLDDLDIGPNMSDGEANGIRNFIFEKIAKIEGEQT